MIGVKLLVFLRWILRKTMQARERVELALARDRNSRIFLVCTVIGYTAFFSVMTILRYRSLNASAYDLGIYNQSFYTAARSGRLFYYTTDLPANPKGSILGAHFSPVFFLLLPVYAIFPTPETLLIFQSFSLALGAVPLFYLGKKLISIGTASLFVVLYLTGPLIAGVNWYDFHPECFIPLGFLMAIYAMESKKPRMYFAGILFTLSSLEFAAALTALYSLIIIVDSRASLISDLKTRKLGSRGPLALVSFLVSVVWALVAVAAVGFFNPTQTFLFGGANAWSVLGATSLVTVPVAAILDPLRASTALSYELPQKIIFLILVFGPFALFLAKAFRFAVLTLPWTFILLLSNQTSYYQFNDQYLVFFLPFLFTGSVYGWQKLGHTSQSNRRLVRNLKLGSIAFGLIVLILVTPFVNVSLVGGNVFGYRGIPSLGTHEQLVAQVVSLVPPEASILTEGNIFPLVSSRVNAFLFPYQSFYPPGTGFNSTLSEFISQSEFILVDTKTDAVTPTWLIHVLAQFPTHGLYASADGILLYKRGYQGPLTFFVPIQQTWGARGLVLGWGSIVADHLSSGGDSLFHSTKNLNDTTFWSGPNVVLSPGKYVVDFRLRTGSPIVGYLLLLEVSANIIQVRTQLVSGVGGGYNILFYPYLQSPDRTASMKLYGENFTRTGYQDFYLHFTLANNGYFNFQGVHASNLAELYLDRISLMQESANP